MKDINETIKIIYERGDAALAEKKRRNIIIRRVAFSVSGLCAAVIVGVGLWNSDSIREGMKNKFDKPVIESTECTTTVSSSEPPTSGAAVSESTAAVSSTEKNSSASTSKSISVPTTVSAVRSTKATAAIVSSASSTVHTSAGSAKTTAKTIKPPVSVSTVMMTTAAPATISPVTSTTLNCPDTAVPTTKATTATEIIKPPDTGIVTPPSAATVCPVLTTESTQKILPEIFMRLNLESDGETRYYYYSGSPPLPEESVGEFLTEYTFTISSGDSHTGSVYFINDVPEKAVLAVKFDGDDKYYCYSNNFYVPETLGDILSMLTPEDLNETAVYRLVFDNKATEYQISDREKLLEMIKAYSEYVPEEMPPNSFYRIYEVKCVSKTFGLNVTIDITSHGWISIHKNSWYYRFHIGANETGAIIKYAIIGEE